MRVAFVHDWLNGMRGGEKCLEAMLELFPDSEIFTLLYEKEKVSPPIQKMNVSSSWIQNLPFWRTRYRYYLPFFPRAIESLKIEGFDLVLSISHCVAKGIPIIDGTPHVSYCLTPMRYIWGFEDVYFSSKMFRFLKPLGLNSVLSYLRKWDNQTASAVDHFIAISNCVKDRIHEFYDRDAVVIYPPVDTDQFYYQENESKEDYDLVVSALVPYKRIDLVIQAYNELGRPLKVVGAGTEYIQLKEMSRSNIEFLGWVNDADMRLIYAKASLLLFPGVEDFGIVPLEAQACGTPVLAFQAGGALETVIDGRTGSFFHQQNINSLKENIERMGHFDYDRADLRENALRFSRDKFKENMYNALINCKKGKI